jgi:hypothetical protein
MAAMEFRQPESSHGRANLCQTSEPLRPATVRALPRQVCRGMSQPPPKASSKFMLFFLCCPLPFCWPFSLFWLFAAFPGGFGGSARVTVAAMLLPALAPWPPELHILALPTEQQPSPIFSRPDAISQSSRQPQVRPLLRAHAPVPVPSFLAVAPSLQTANGACPGRCSVPSHAGFAPLPIPPHPRRTPVCRAAAASRAGRKGPSRTRRASWLRSRTCLDS